MIDSAHLLWGLTWPNASRAQVLFRLGEKFPQYRQGPDRSLLIASRSQELLLTIDANRILAWSAMEADAMGDAWVDTDHLVLGMLRESECQAAQQLTTAGLTLEDARAIVRENQLSRPDYGPIIPLGKKPSPRVWLRSKWCWWKARRSERRFVAQRQK